MEDEVVISGVAGRFPGCDNVESLKDLLFNKVSGVTSDNRRWDKGELEVPHYLGKINDPYKLDLTFFGVNSKLGESMDPQTKLVMEAGFSAICDAGINPSDLAGSNTATLIGSSLAETEYECLITRKRMDQTILSHAVSMQAHRIAYYLDLRGPSYVCDASWNGGLYVMRYARDQISRGNFSSALVVCTNLIFMPQVSYHYHRLGRLNEDGKTKCFSDNADGYTRSEGCVAFFLQRKEHAFRNYGTVIGVSSSLYASKNSPLADCSEIPIFCHLQNLYKKTKVDPSLICYLEAAGCASKVVDASELNAVAEMFLPNKKEPLLIGSIKSNVGHTEAASGFLGILKVIIAAECGMIPPNINYSSPNNLVPSLTSGKLAVVTEPTPLNGDYLAVNNITAAGDFGHVIIKRNLKTKKRPTEVGVLPPDGIPRLVLLSGRVEAGLIDVIKMVEEMPIDEEFLALTHRVFDKGIKNHIYRGYTVLDEDSTNKYRLIKPYQGGERRPLWFVFTGMGSQWAGMGETLMKIPIFAKAIQFCHDHLKPHGLDVISIVTNPDQSIFDNILNAFIGITSVQIGLVDIMNEIGLEPDGIVGHSFGELACAYCDGSISAEQAILAAYNRGKISIEAKVEPGLMAAIGVGYKELERLGLPESIDVACHNSHDSCTISGPVEDVKLYVGELQEKGIFARSVATGGIAYHSRYIQSLGQQFRDELRKIIPTPKIRSSKWISSSVPVKDWDTELGKYSSAEYHTNNLLHSVLFEEACAYIPKNAIVIEIAPHGLLQAILKRLLPFATHIPLTNRTEPNSLKFLLAGLGRMYTEGVYVDVPKLYPPVEFPVSRGTPSLASLLNWSSAGSFKPWTFLQRRKNFKISKQITYTNSNSRDERFLKYTVNGIPVIPGSAYISTIMEEYLKFKNEDLTKIMFQDINFNNLVKYSGETTVFMTFQKGSGEWEICKENEIVTFGKVDFYIHGFKTQPIKKMDGKSCNHIILKDQVYSHLEALGLTVHPDYKLIKSLSIEEIEATAEILWNGDWLAFLDAALKIVEFYESIEHNALNLISFIERITIDLSLFKQKEVCLLTYNKAMGLIWGHGIEILCPSTSRPNIPLGKSSLVEKKTEFLRPKFTPYQALSNCSLDNWFENCLMIAIDNLYNRTNKTIPKFIVIEILENMTTPKVINDILRKQNNIKVKRVTVASDTLLLNTGIKENYSFVISGSSMLENTLKVLNHSEGGFLIYKGKSPPPSLAVVNSEKIENEQFYFCKTVKKAEEKPFFVFFNTDWKSSLIKSLNQEGERLNYLVAQFTSLPAIHDIMEQSMVLENSHLLRFVFIDSKLSSFQADEYEDYFRKDLRVNIFVNGMWGTSLLYPITLSLPSASESNESIFSFSSIKCPNVELYSLGLNSPETSKTIEEPAVYEYSGTSKGKDICGLATLNEGKFELEPDPLYQWFKPKNLRHEEVSSLLLVYAMAYYILDIESSSKSYRSILIHDGLRPLSQAFINLAIRRKFNVFITYDGKAENKEYLKNNYPQIHEDNIFSFNTSQIEVQLLLKTKGKGVDLVVNTLTDTKKLKSTLRCLGRNKPLFFQVIIPSMHPGFSIGLSSLLNGASLHCWYPEALISLPVQMKLALRDLISSGLRTGEIKPVSYDTISSSSLNIDTVPRIKYDVTKKVVVFMKEMCISTTRINSYIFDLHKVCLIIGDRDGRWFTLLDWLITRGARKFIIGISSLSSVAAQKLNTALTIHNHLCISTRSAKKLGSMNDVKTFIDGIENRAEIDTVFVTGEENQETINYFTSIFDKTRIIAICSGTGIFQENHNISSMALIIKTKYPDYSCILEALDSLMNLHETVIYVNQFDEIDIETDSSALQHWQHIPTSLQEISSSARSTVKPFWKELRTNSPSYKHCREVSPVFILPSLKKGQMKSLIRSLLHPAFEAVLPSYFENPEKLALHLLTEMKKFPCSVFTIICSDWAWLLGLELGINLERLGKTVSLILLGVSPKWAEQDSVKRVYAQAIKNMSQSDLEAHNKFELEKGLEILQERVRLITNHTLNDNYQFKGFCHLVTFMKPTDTAMQQLKQACQRNVNIFTIDDTDYLSMLNNNVTTDFINSNILFEHKDCARLMNKDYETVLQYNLCHLEE